MRGCCNVVASGATLPTRSGLKKRLGIGVMSGWGRGSFDCFLYESIEMGWKLVAPLVTIYGRLKTSDVDGFLHTALVPVTVP